MNDLIARIQSRVADPLRAVDTARWVEPLPKIAPVASMADVDAAEAALRSPPPPLLRRLYTEVGNGGWAPGYGLYGIPVGGAKPDENDLVGFYRVCTATNREIESPAAAWPRGLVPLLSRGCVDYELCDFLRSPFPVCLLNGDAWEPDQPVVKAMTPVTPSLADRLEDWLAAEANES